jgi:hypothetical protein
MAVQIIMHIVTTYYTYNTYWYDLEIFFIHAEQGLYDDPRFNLFKEGTSHTWKTCIIDYIYHACINFPLVLIEGLVETIGFKITRAKGIANIGISQCVGIVYIALKGTIL